MLEITAITGNTAFFILSRLVMKNTESKITVITNATIKIITAALVLQKLTNTKSEQ
jgi:hypothetical protein